MVKIHYVTLHKSYTVYLLKGERVSKQSLILMILRLTECYVFYRFYNCEAIRYGLPMKVLCEENDFGWWVRAENKL